jgi:hypothetical protein
MHSNPLAGSNDFPLSGKRKPIKATWAVSASLRLPLSLLPLVMAFVDIEARIYVSAPSQIVYRSMVYKLF